MNDIFDENEEMKDSVKIAYKLIELYKNSMKRDDPHVDVDIKRRRIKLATNHADIELLAQVIRDAAILMQDYDLRPQDIR